MLWVSSASGGRKTQHARASLKRLLGMPPPPPFIAPPYTRMVLVRCKSLFCEFKVQSSKLQESSKETRGAKMGSFAQVALDPLLSLFIHNSCCIRMLRFG